MGADLWLVKRDDYKKGLVVKLAQPIRVRCCGCEPIPQDAQIVLFDQVGPNRAIVGLYFGPDAPLGGENPAFHHKVWPIRKLEKNIPGGMKKGTGKAGDIFPNGGFCLHKVKISGIQGEVLGEVNKEIFEKAGSKAAQESAAQEN